jgi:hypothetical protein
MREWFQRKGYTPMIVDFERPDSLSLTETVITMAGLSKFVVGDLSGSSVPAELQGIFSNIKRPLLTVGDPYPLFRDIEDLTRVVPSRNTGADLLTMIEKNLSKLEELHTKRIVQLAERYPPNTQMKPTR